MYQTEAVTRRCSVKNLFLEILHNSQENTCARASFFIKLQASGHMPRLAQNNMHQNDAFFRGILACWSC